MTKILTIKEYSNTSSFFFRKEIKFMVGFIYFFLSLIITFFVWSYYFHLDILVKARGIVRPTKEISTIINIFEGKVDSINYFNGKE